MQDIGRVKKWIAQKQQKELNKSKAEQQLDHQFGTGRGSTGNKWKKRNKGAYTYKWQLTGFKTWDQWQELAKQKELEKRKRQQSKIEHEKEKI